MADRDPDNRKPAANWRFRVPVIAFLLLFAWMAISRLSAGGGSIIVWTVGLALFAAMAGGFVWILWREDRDKS